MADNPNLIEILSKTITRDDLNRKARLHFDRVNTDLITTFLKGHNLMEEDALETIFTALDNNNKEWAFKLSVIKDRSYVALNWGTFRKEHNVVLNSRLTFFWDTEHSCVRLELPVAQVHVDQAPSVDYYLVGIIEDGFVRVLDDSGNTKDDLRLPSDEILLKQIMDGVTKGVDVTVSVMLEGGEEHICNVKYS